MKLPTSDKVPFHFKITIEVNDLKFPGRPSVLRFEVAAPPLPAKPSQPAFVPDEPHRIRLLVPNIGPQGLGIPTSHGFDHNCGLRLLAELALCLAVTTPTPQNQESYENPAQN
jgi:hypothetical protein